MRTSILMSGLLLGTAGLLAGCASPAPIRYQNLASSPSLQPDQHMHHGHEPYIYRSKVDWGHYHRFIMSPVIVYQGPDAQFDSKISMKDREALADDMQVEFTQRLSQRYTQTLIPTGDTLEVQVTLTGARHTKAFIGTFTKFDMGGTPINLLQAARGREGLFNGSISYAVEIHDAGSHQLLLAYVDKQYPNAMNIKASFGALSAARVGIHKAADNLLGNLK
ncbi:DUF3313 domain-containing protein [Frateuria aurantia]